MRIEHLRYFAAIIELDSSIKAAARMGVSQPALSTAMRALESEIGRRLFDRPKGRGLQATASGRAFYERACRILGEFDAAVSEARGNSQAPGRLRLGVLPTLEVEAVGRWVARVRAAFSSWRVEVWEGSRDNLQNWLQEERIDAAVSVIDRKHRSTAPLLIDPFVLLVSYDSDLGRSERASVRLSELADTPIISRGFCEMLPEALKLFSRARYTPRVVARPERDHLALGLAAQGMGALFAPISIAPPMLKAIRVADLPLERRIGLLWRQGLDREVLRKLRDAVT